MGCVFAAVILMTAPFLLKDSLLEKNATTLLSVVAKWIFFIRDDASVSGRGNDFRRVQTQMRTAARDTWHATLLRLRALSSEVGGRTDYQQILHCWVELGNTLGLREDAERARHGQQGNRLCSRATCRFYCSPAPNTLRVCKGCQEVRYCSRECQQRCGTSQTSVVVMLMPLSDWKQGGHRAVCRRLEH